jgi:hypothetical protein
MFGTLEEIAARKSFERPMARTAVTDGSVPGTIPGDELGFEINACSATNAGDRTAYDWMRSETEMPPLPQKLATSQSARLAEIFDFLHRGLAAASENIQANENGSEIRICFAEWQSIQATQLFLARYMRAVADPEHHPD